MFLKHTKIRNALGIPLEVELEYYKPYIKTKNNISKETQSLSKNFKLRDTTTTEATLRKQQNSDSLSSSNKKQKTDD